MRYKRDVMSAPAPSRPTSAAALLVAGGTAAAVGQWCFARAHAALGERAAAERHLALAAAYGPTLGLQALYAGKLQRLRAQGAH